MIKRYFLQIGSWIYRHTVFQLKKIHVQRKTKSTFARNVYFRNTDFEGRNFVDQGAYVANCHIGYGSNINRFSNISETWMGRFCSIAPNVEVVIGQHPVRERFVSTHAAFYSERTTAGFTYRNETVFPEQRFPKQKLPIGLKDGCFSQVIIGNDVWIASDVRILAGVTIGDGAVIGACSLVTKDVEPYGIYVGVPAKRIGYRFEPEIIEKLEKMKWWEHDEVWLREHAEEFDHVDTFVRTYADALK